MDMEEFCNSYCPMPFRSEDRAGGTEIDCDCEAEECPFKQVDFAAVHKNDITPWGGYPIKP